MAFPTLPTMCLQCLPHSGLVEFIMPLSGRLVVLTNRTLKKVSQKWGLTSSSLSSAVSRKRSGRKGLTPLKCSTLKIFSDGKSIIQIKRNNTIEQSGSGWGHLSKECGQAWVCTTDGWMDEPQNDAPRSQPSYNAPQLPLIQTWTLPLSPQTPVRSWPI